MFGLGLLDYVKFGAGVAVGAGLIFFPARWIGQGEGKQMAATASLSKSVAVLRERNVINDQVSVSDAAALCADLQLSDDDKAECVRRVQSADAKSGDVGNDPADRSTVRQPGRGPQ